MPPNTLEQIGVLDNAHQVNNDGQVRAGLIHGRETEFTEESPARVEQEKNEAKKLFDKLQKLKEESSVLPIEKYALMNECYEMADSLGSMGLFSSEKRDGSDIANLNYLTTQEKSILRPQYEKIIEMKKRLPLLEQEIDANNKEIINKSQELKTLTEKQIAYEKELRGLLGSKGELKWAEAEYEKRYQMLSRDLVALLQIRTEKTRNQKMAFEEQINGFEKRLASLEQFIQKSQSYLGFSHKEEENEKQTFGVLTKLFSDTSLLSELNDNQREYIDKERESLLKKYRSQAIENGDKYQKLLGEYKKGNLTRIEQEKYESRLEEMMENFQKSYQKMGELERTAEYPEVKIVREDMSKAIDIIEDFDRKILQSKASLLKNTAEGMWNFVNSNYLKTPNPKAKEDFIKNIVRGKNKENLLALEEKIGPEKTHQLQDLFDVKINQELKNALENINSDQQDFLRRKSDYIKMQILPFLEEIDDQERYQAVKKAFEQSKKPAEITAIFQSLKPYFSQTITGKLNRQDGFHSSKNLSSATENNGLEKTKNNYFIKVKGFFSELKKELAEKENVLRREKLLEDLRKETANYKEPIPEPLSRELKDKKDKLEYQARLGALESKIIESGAGQTLIAAENAIINFFDRNKGKITSEQARAIIDAYSQAKKNVGEFDRKDFFAHNNQFSEVFKKLHIIGLAKMADEIIKSAPDSSLPDEATLSNTEYKKAGFTPEELRVLATKYNTNNLDQAVEMAIKEIGKAKINDPILKDLNREIVRKIVLLNAIAEEPNYIKTSV